MRKWRIRWPPQELQPCAKAWRTYIRPCGGDPAVVAEMAVSVKRFGIGVVLALILSAAAALWAFPLAAAVLCPPCMGMERIAPGLIVERGLGDSDHKVIREYAAAAKKRVQSVLGPLPDFMTIVACTSADCQDRLGPKGPRGLTYAVPGFAVIQLAPSGVNPVIMSHEISHATLQTRAGWFLSYPQWFDEGLAVVISGDPRYLTLRTNAGDCKFAPQADLPATLSAWNRAVGDRTRVVYGEAACSVRQWLDVNGGFASLTTVIADARAGKRTLP